MTHTNPLSLEILTGLFRTSPKDAQRIINREGTTIEFKETYNHGSMAQYFRAIAAFANNSGGYILFGVGDKPRRLLGLKEKSLRQFEELKVDEFTKNLLDYFSPEIKWDHCTFEFHEMSFGVIYIYPLMHKPCICKKHYDDKILVLCSSEQGTFLFTAAIAATRPPHRPVPLSFPYIREKAHTPPQAGPHRRETF